ncbi:cortactin-binding protein 2 isoform X1 [Hemiscyllium ocellatum]|uniref:cortactin-binding protein 2 isoform X1 n=1 Tax=Hemiscyllium ocellatum TaxID=170820 RepID=UPI002966CEAD|nr:cortactin-binding protein 2 isoform X1 [Hemiscyllium ocellatum]
MATESELRPDSGDPSSEERAPSVCQKSEFDLDSLNKTELLTFLSILEGELEARDLVIETLRSRRKDVFTQERYGTFNLSDPFLALQRDYEAGGDDGNKDKQAICASPLSILQIVMDHCKKMQERMSAQLAAAEIRHRKVILDLEEERHKHAQDAAQGDDVTYMLEKERERLLQQVEFEKSQLKQLETENKKLSMQLEEERIKNKQLVMMLVKECKQLAGKVVDESQTLADITKTLDAEQKKTSQLEEELLVEKKKSLQMEAKMEKQLSEFDIEREQLRAKLNREENRTKDLRLEVESLKKMIEHNCIKEDGTVSLTNNLNKDMAIGYSKQTMLSVASQTETLLDIANDNKTVPVKPVNPVSVGGTKLFSNTALVKPISDKLLATINSEETISTTQTKVVPSSLENGPSISTSPSPLPGALPHLVGGTSLVLSNTVVPSPPPSGTTSPCSSPGATMQSLSSPSICTTLQPGLSPRIQAARFKFQAQTVDQEKHSCVVTGSPSRDLSPTSRDNSPAKQLARNTVSQVLSRFTGPPSIVKPPCANSASPFGTESRNLPVSNLKPGLAHPTVSEGSPYPQVAGKIASSLSVSPAGLKSPTGARVDRGNPPPIPPKKPGLSQTPSSPHPPLKVFMDGNRSPTVGFNTRNESRTMASSSSSPHPGIKGTNEEILPKTSLPQLPPKPAVDIASTGCAVPAVAASQVGARPSLSPQLNQTACSEYSLITTTTIASSTSIDLASTTKRTSSTRPCETDSLLITSSGRSPSLIPSLLSGGPVPLGGRSILLHQAAAQGNVTLLSMLLNEDGIDINHPDEEGSSALYSAAKNGYTDCVTLLLNSGAQVDVIGNNSFTPLCAAAAEGHVGCAEVLITYDANINYAAEGGQTPLYLSCLNGHTECTLSLLEAGADCGIRTVDGWAPFHAAVSTGHVDCLKLLMHHKVSGDRRFADDSEHKLSSVDPECAEGSDKFTVEPKISADLINHADKDGWTAAHIAASKGFKNCLEVLCCHKGLDPHKKDNCQRTVLDVATDDCKHLLENWNAHKVLLQISLKHSENVYNRTEHIENNITIGSLTIRKLTTWDDLSKAVTVTLRNHFKTVMDGWESSEASAFLHNTEYSFTSSSISAVQIGDEIWKPGQVLMSSPWSLVHWSQNNLVTVFLNGLQEGCLDSMAYASLLPVCLLQNYLRLVEQYHNVIFHGPVGSCQDHIAHQIANGIKHKQEAVGSNCEIIQIEMEVSSSKNQLVELFIKKGILVPLRQSPVTQKATVVLIENLERATSLSEFLGELLDALENRGAENPFTFQHVDGTSETYYFQENSFLIGTMAKMRLQSSDLMVQQHFRWVQLRWDVEPISGLLQRFLKRQIIHEFQGQLPAPTDPTCKAVQWVCRVWHQLNSYLSRLGTPEALMGPRDFFSCPILPGQVQPIIKWMASLWNSVIAPRAEEAILSRASVKRPSRQGQPVNKILNQGQQAVVKAALSILLNKAVLHGCSLSRQEFEQYAPEFQGWSFPLTMISNYKASKKKIDSNAWRKVSTGPRKKSIHSVSPSWSKFDGQREGIQLMPELPKSFNKLNTQVKLHSLESGPLKTADLEQGLALYDEDVDIIEELQSMCLSKSESDISKIDVSKDLSFLIPNSQRDQSSLKMLKNHHPAELPVPKVLDCPVQNGTPMSSSSTKRMSRSGISRMKSHLPVLLNNTDRIHRSNSNTRHSESNINTTKEVWNLCKTLQETNKK